MANDLLTVADHLADGLDISNAEVSDLLNKAPFLARLPVTTSSNGTVHKYTKETGAPVVGFRAENAGRDFDHSVDTLVTVNLKILDFGWQVDKAVADAWRKGGRNALIAREGRRHLREAFFVAEQQYLNGTVGGLADGFAGFADSSGLDGLADEMVVNAGGTTINTASSVYFVRLGEDDVTGVMIDGNSLELGSTVVQNAIDGTGKNYPVYYTPGCSWLGIQIGGARSIGRICNLTEDSGKGLTDDLIYSMLERFPVGMEPNLAICTRRSREQLRKSRTATNATGAPAPIPMEVAGIPLLTTDALSNTEALIA